MKVFNPIDSKHDDPCIFNFRLRKADIKFEELFKSRCRRAINLVSREPRNDYEIDKALEAAIKMKGTESTHFELVSSGSYKRMNGRKQLYLLRKLHQEKQKV